jgi:hypothetical protein
VLAEAGRQRIGQHGALGVDPRDQPAVQDRGHRRQPARRRRRRMAQIGVAVLEPA